MRLYTCRKGELFGIPEFCTTRATWARSCRCAVAGELLRPDAFFLFEIGYDQGEKIKTLALEGGYACEVYKDFSHNDRVAYLTPIGEEKKEIIT